MIGNQILRLLFLVAAATLSLAQTSQQTAIPHQPVVAILDAAKVGEPISAYDYGMFIEHLGNIINHGLVKDPHAQ
jgi:hypothetical protein